MDTKKKIYFVETTVPGNFGGGEIRNFNIIKQLARQTNAHLELFCIASEHPEIVQKESALNSLATIHVVANHTRTAMSVLRSLLFLRVPPYMNDFKSSELGAV